MFCSQRHIITYLSPARSCLKPQPEPQHNPAIPLLSKKWKLERYSISYLLKHYSQQPGYRNNVSVSERVDQEDAIKETYLSIYIYSYTIEYSPMTQKEILPLATTWPYKGSMTREIQTEKDKYCMILITRGIKTKCNEELGRCSQQINKSWSQQANKSQRYNAEHCDHI